MARRGGAGRTEVQGVTRLTIFDETGAELRGTEDGDAIAAALARAFPRFAADFEWWAEAGQRQRALRQPPY